MVFGYDTDISPAFGSNQTRIRSIALDLLNEIRNQRQEDDEINRPLILIGHSLGGLIIKRALIVAAQDPGNDRGEIYRSIKSVMFFGTPHAGSHADQKKRVLILKKMATAAFTEVPPKIQSALEMHSDELLDLGDDFRRIDICKNNKLYIYSFFESLDTKLLGERVVDEFSARVNASVEEALPINADHENMVKYADETDKNFKNVVATIKRLQRLARTSVERPRISERAFLISGHNLLPIEGGADMLGDLPVPGDDLNHPQKKSCIVIPIERKISNFIGRQDLLNKIADHFEPAITSQCTAPVKLSLIGMGGIGKSQLALEYCQRAYAEKRFQTVFWINALSEDTVIASFAKIAAVILPNHDKLGTQEKVQNALIALQMWQHPFLLIYDNYDDPEFDEVLKYIPVVGTGALLFTSRLVSSGILLGASLEVDVMDEDMALSLLESRSGLKTFPDSSERRFALETVHLLDGLPLAVDQAGAYIRAGGGVNPFERFVGLYSSRRHHILQQLPKFWQYKEVASETQKSRCLSVYTTWELSLRLLGSGEEDHRKKIHFLTVAAFLGGHRTSHVFFKAYSGKNAATTKSSENWTSIFHDPVTFNVSCFRDVIAEVADLSLIRGFTETSNGGIHFTFHSLVQDWIIQRLDTTKRRAFLDETLQVMKDFFTTFESDISWSPDLYKVIVDNPSDQSHIPDTGLLVGDMIQELVAHVSACIRLCEEVGLKLDGDNTIEIYFASILGDCGQIENAVTIFERIAENLKQSLGENHDDVLSLRAGVCLLWLQSDMFAQNKNSIEAFLLQTETVKGLTHRLTLRLLFGLVMAYNKSAERTKAQETLAKVSDTLKGVKLEHEYLLLTLQVVRVLTQFKLLEDAEILLDRVFEVLPEPTKDWSIYQLGYLCLGDLQIARDKYADAEQTISIYTTAAIAQLGSKHHPGVLLGNYALSNCYLRTEQWSKAETLIRPFYEYCVTAIGFGHHFSQAVIARICRCWMNMNPTNTELPDATIRKMIEECQKIHGRNSVNTFVAQREASLLYYDQGRYEISFQYINEARKGYCSLLEITDEARIDTESGCAASLEKWGKRRKEDVEDLSEVQKTRLIRLEAENGDDAAITMKLRKLYATWLFNIDHFQRALPYYEKQRDILAETTGKTGEDYWALCGDLASCFRQLSRYTEAINLWEEVLEWRREFYGTQHGKVLNALIILGHALYNSGQYNVAKERYTEVLQHNAAIHGENSAETMKIRGFLATNANKARNYVEAAEQYKIMLQWNLKQESKDEKQIIDVTTKLAHTLYNQETIESYRACEDHYRKVLEWTERDFDKDSKDVMYANDWLMNCLFKLDQGAESAIFARKVLSWKEANYGLDHEETITTSVTLARALLASGRAQTEPEAKNAVLTEGRDILLHAVSWSRSKYGTDKESTLSYIDSLGTAYFCLNSLDQSKECYAEVLTVSERIHGPSSNKTMFALGQAREVAMQLKDWTVAEELTERKLKWLKSEKANEGLTAQETYLLGLTHLHQRKYSTAAENIGIGVAWKIKESGPKAPATIKASYWHGQCFEGLKDYERAMELYELAIQWQDAPPEWKTFQVDAQVRLQRCGLLLSSSSEDPLAIRAAENTTAQ